MESGPAPARSLTEPGRTTVQLLVACSAVLALLQLVAASSVDVYNGQRAGWWVTIQGATVAFAAAFAGAAAGANGAWWRRMQEKAGSTTPASLGTAIAASGVAGAVFAVLVWASSTLAAATYPMALAVLIAALFGGVVGGVRAGGAVLGGLVCTFVFTLVNLVGQAFTTMFVLAPAVGDGAVGRGTPLPLSAANWAVSVVAGTLAGVWWLSKRRQNTTLGHCLLIALYPMALVIVGNVAGLVAWLMVNDDTKDDAFGRAAASNALELAVLVVVGGLTALVAGRALRTRRSWPSMPARRPASASLTDPEPPASATQPPGTAADQPGYLGGQPGPAGGQPGPIAEQRADPPPVRTTTVRQGNGVVKSSLNKLIPSQSHRGSLGTRSNDR